MASLNARMQCAAIVQRCVAHYDDTNRGIGGAAPERLQWWCTDRYVPSHPGPHLEQGCVPPILQLYRQNQTFC